MPNHKSATKRVRQLPKRTKINQVVSSKFKNILNILDKNIQEKDKKSAEDSLKWLNSALDKAVKRNIIKKENASRKLSSLSKK